MATGRQLDWVAGLSPFQEAKRGSLEAAASAATTASGGIRREWLALHSLELGRLVAIKNLGKFIVEDLAVLFAR